MKKFKLGIILLVIALIGGSLLACQNNEVNTTDNNIEVNDQVKENTTDDTTVEKTAAYVNDTYLVNADYLSVNLTNENILILDARGDDPYSKGHIPGAIAISWPMFSNVAGSPGDAGWGVVLDQASLSEKLAAIGVDETKEIIVYADTQKGWGEDGRIVWMLRMAGLENSKILDGGYNYWEANNYQTTKDVTEAVATEFTITSFNKDLTIETDALNQVLDQAIILDTREANEFDGDANFGEVRGGHLPNARLLTFNEVLNEDGTFKSAEELNTLFSSIGLQTDDVIITYCTAGIRSAHLQIALNMMGYENVKNYDASFYEYAAIENLPLEDKIIVKDNYRYFSANQLKLALEANTPLTLLDIQVEEDYNSHHIVGAIATYAYPVKTDEDKAKLDDILTTIENTTSKVVIVCPRGGGGAERTYDYLLEKGINVSRLFILEDGQEGWPFEDLLEK